MKNRRNVWAMLYGASSHPLDAALPASSQAANQEPVIS
jgi:hypothetical protein